MSVTKRFTIADSSHLLGGQNVASAWGDIVWVATNSSWRGRVDVGCCGYGDGQLAIEMQYRPATASEPTLVYLIEGTILARVDVNGPHEGRRFTHKQWYRESGGALNTADVPKWFRPVPFIPTIDDDVLERAFHDAAKTLHVDTSAVVWSAPPEGRAR